MFSSLLKRAGKGSDKVDDFPGTFTRVRKGYSETEVDQYLESIATGLENGTPPPPDEVLNKTFAIVRNGYDQTEVHIYLAEISEQIAHAG